MKCKYTGRKIVSPLEWFKQTKQRSVQIWGGVVIVVVTIVLALCNSGKKAPDALQITDAEAKKNKFQMHNNN